MILDNIFRIVLVVSGVSLAVSLITALAYELYAVISMRLPVISHIAELWIMTHKLLASGIAALVLAFIIWLFIHWFVLPNDLIVRK